MDLKEKIEGLMNKRSEIYEDAATIIVDTDDKCFEDILKNI